MVTARFRTLFLLPAAAGVLMLAGCGDPATEPGGPGVPPVAPSSTGVPSGSAPGPTKPVPPDQTGAPTESGRPITVEGIVETGVEPNCKILTGGGGRYLILGGKDVPLGVPVRIEGVLMPGVLSTCQQGTPLRVTNVQRR